MNCDGGTVTDGSNCWGDCVTNCDYNLPNCAFETRSPSTADGCFIGFSRHLCCAHCSKGGDFEIPLNKTAATETHEVTRVVENQA